MDRDHRCARPNRWRCCCSDVETWNDTATTIAREYRRLGGEFTAADVCDSVDVTARQVRRVLVELIGRGYLHQTTTGPGRAHVYEPAADAPRAGEVDLPERERCEGGSGLSNQYNGVSGYQGRKTVDGWSDTGSRIRELGTPPSPVVAGGSDPPE